MVAPMTIDRPAQSRPVLAIVGARTSLGVWALCCIDCNWRSTAPIPQCIEQLQAHNCDGEVPDGA